MFNVLKWDNLKDELSNFDIINATSLGLKNNEDFKISFNNVKKELIYIDTIYNPIETKTLKTLKEKELNFQAKHVCLSDKSPFIYGIRLIQK